MHFLAWLLPLAFLNTEVDEIRGWCTLAAFAVAGLFHLPCVAVDCLTLVVPELLVLLPLSSEGRFIQSRSAAATPSLCSAPPCKRAICCRSGRRVPVFMRRFLESYEHNLLVHVFSNNVQLMFYELPFLGTVRYSTIAKFVSIGSTLYGLVYSAIAGSGIECSSLL